MSVDTVKEVLKQDFPANYREIGGLVLLEFRAENPKKSLLFVSSDHGDEVSETHTLIKKALQLSEKLVLWADIDIVPIVDAEGYPDRKTSVGYSGFGQQKYLDATYFMESSPEAVRNLRRVLKAKPYDLACMLNSRFREDAHALDGFFVEPQIEVRDEKLAFSFKEASDLIGFILHSLAENNCALLNADEGYLGGGYSLFKKGLVIPGREENEKVVWETALGFNKYCQQNNIPSLALTTVSSKTDVELQKGSLKAHETALEAIIEFYQQFRKY